MEAIIERACGLDVGEASLVACLLVGKADEKPHKVIRSFGTTTRDLLALQDWLLAEGCTHVAMESTGVYWKPVYNILEGSFDITVGNAHHIRNVPGRKTDMKDSEWIAELLRHGLIAKSFVPPPPIRELRDLVRYRRKLVESRTAERNRLLKLLESANIKISSVMSDVFGASGTLMLRALVTGEASPQEMAELAKGKLRQKLRALEFALEGRLQSHHRFLLGLQISRLEQVEVDLARLDSQIGEVLGPFRPQIELLSQIPGVGTLVAAAVIAEIGTDMSVFHSAAHLAAWAGICPGNHESAGKRRNVKARKGNHHLRTALVEAAQAVTHTRGTFLRDKFFRLKARRGYNRAILAVGHKILVAAYHMLRGNLSYRELGDHYLDSISEKHIVRTLIRRLERLGYEVKAEKKAA